MTEIYDGRVFASRELASVQTKKKTIYNQSQQKLNNRGNMPERVSQKHQAASFIAAFKMLDWIFCSLFELIKIHVCVKTNCEGSLKRMTMDFMEGRM